MIIVVTDEVGDDEPRLGEAIAAANAAKIPVYVLGSQALFGRVDGYMNYTDPKTKQTYYNLPVRQGPESVALEQIRLPFWYDGPQYEALDAGFGPYALSRLAGATGGIYFVTRMGPDRISFDPAPDARIQARLGRPDQYEASLQRHPIRQAVLRAAQITQQNLPGQPSLTFPAGRRARVQGGDGAEPGDRRADRLHRRRGPGADHRRGQAPRPRELAPLAGPL